MSRVLVVDDELAMRTALQASFANRGWPVESACGMQDALTKFQRGRHDLVVTDIRMPDGDGLEVMRQVRAIDPRTAVILLTAFGSIPDAVEAMRRGACDYVVKPVVFEELERAARRILKSVSTSQSNDMEHQLIGHSPAWMQALRKARQVAATDADVLIQAESGTGKEMVARLLHQLSRRAQRPLIAINCAAFPEALLESELFGHAKGAFTGAVNAKPGKFEMAQGGTILLDEVGEMPIALQPKLLRALQEREVDRLGDTRTLKLDIRVIATTNRSLKEMVREGTFRADLFYRLNVIPLTLPPLRERPEDIPELALHYARRFSPSGEEPRLSAQFLDHLKQRRWPGNVRELANYMHRVVALNLAGVEDEPLDGENEVIPAAAPKELLGPGVSLGEMEKRLLEMTLDATHGNRSRAAEMLGISLRTVRNKIREYGLPARQNYVHD